MQSGRIVLFATNTICKSKKIMLTAQTNIALSVINTLSKEELEAFSLEFFKIYKPKSNIEPKKKKRTTFLKTEDLAAQILAKHRKKHNTINL